MKVFIKSTTEGWTHAEWEMFLHDLRVKGIVITKECETYLKNVMEAVKDL
ncbi:hypothetical protein MCHI_002084 [Candidatus Magnetoovum chiemensis]|nr:hypothetical protein MCHI_002084 [Candidatus Magnetoovum chiemensis]